MSTGLPDPQLMSNAQALNNFASAVSQAAIYLINTADKTSAEYEKIKAYYKENLPQLRVIVDNLVDDVG